jgi:translation initiation factor 1 (eIF-1/SUI1)
MAPKALAGGTLWLLVEKKSTFVSSTSNQHTANQPTDDKKKGGTVKEVVVDPDDTDKKLHLSTKLDAK